MPEGIVIRGYRDGDLQSCRALWRELTERHREIYRDGSIGGDDPGRYFDEHLSKVGAANILVAEAGSEAVAMVGIVEKEGEVELEPVVVGSSHRGRGVGHALLDAAVEVARQRGAKYVCVRPVARNAEAMRFFWECGFRNMGQVEMFADLSGKEWKDGLSLHGLRFTY